MVEMITNCCLREEEGCGKSAGDGWGSAVDVGWGDGGGGKDCGGGGREGEGVECWGVGSVPGVGLGGGAEIEE